MSNTTFFCFITFCVDLPLDLFDEMAPITSELRKQERTVEFIEQQLEKFENELKLIQEWDVNHIPYFALYDAVDAYTDPALKAVRNAVKAARKEGRDSSHCYTIASRVIDDTIRNSNDFEIVPCLVKFIDAVQKILSGVEPLREEIKRIQSYFNETVANCYISTKAVKCLTTSLSTIKKAHERLEKLINLLMNEKETSYPRLKNDLKTCCTAIETLIENAASLVQREGIRCATTTGTPIRQST